jgi:uncharacterized protein (UPF0335 family)
MSLDLERASRQVTASQIQSQPHSAPNKEKTMSDAHGVARDQLRSFIERIERLEEEKKTIADDIKDVYGEAKGTGFDTKILKKVIAIRKQDKDERMEQEAILDTYLAALGMIDAPEAE